MREEFTVFGGENFRGAILRTKLIQFSSVVRPSSRYASDFVRIVRRFLAGRVMYQDYYDLKAEPFPLSSRGDNLYMHDSYKRCMSYLLYAFHRGEGMVLITGLPGSGKTTLIQELVSETSDNEMPVALVDCANLAGSDLLELYLEELGVVAAPGVSNARAVRETLANTRQAKRPVLILDDAQLLSEDDLKTVYMLCNLNQKGVHLVQVVLAGHPKLRETLLSPGYEQFHQRLVATCNIEALEMSETREYILHKLRSAGWTNNPSIAESVFGAIYRSSLGVPRWVDLICSRMMLNAMAGDRKFISLDDICEVIRDLINEDLLPDQVRLSTQKKVA